MAHQHEQRGDGVGRPFTARPACFRLQIDVGALDGGVADHDVGRRRRVLRVAERRELAIDGGHDLLDAPRPRGPAARDPRRRFAAPRNRARLSTLTVTRYLRDSPADVPADGDSHHHGQQQRARAQSPARVGAPIIPPPGPASCRSRTERPLTSSTRTVTSYIPAGTRLNDTLVRRGA